MCFPNENKRSPTGLRQSYSGIWAQIKASVEAEKESWNGFWGGDVPSNKITPLYVPKQRMFPWSVWGLYFGQRQVFKWQFLPPGKISRCTSRDTAIFLKTRNYFGNKLSGTLEVSLWWCAGTRCHWKVCSIKWEQQEMIHKPTAFQWVQTRQKCSDERLYFILKHSVDSELTMMSLLEIA